MLLLHPLDTSYEDLPHTTPLQNIYLTKPSPKHNLNQIKNISICFTHMKYEHQSSSAELGGAVEFCLKCPFSFIFNVPRCYMDACTERSLSTVPSITRCSCRTCWAPTTTHSCRWRASESRSRCTARTRSAPANCSRSLKVIYPNTHTSPSGTTGSLWRICERWVWARCHFAMRVGRNVSHAYEVHIHIWSVILLCILKWPRAVHQTTANHWRMGIVWCVSVSVCM